MRLAEFQSKAVEDLGRIYPEQEARSIVSLLIQERLGLPSYVPVTEPDREIPTDRLDEDLKRLLDNEPIQYVLGYAEFYGRRFRVTPDVLIPRPETEELIEAVLRCPVAQEHDPAILDLCTGSGCIAWTLALEIPDATVVGVDISPKALQVARSQFKDPRVSFRRADVLEISPLASLGRNDNSDVLSSNSDVLSSNSDVLSSNPDVLSSNSDVLSSNSNVLSSNPDVLSSNPDVISSAVERSPEKFDIIVSNPPYVLESERADMRRNVLDYEPALALFVPDEDPLIFYRALAAHAKALLAKNGFGIFEANSRFCGEIAELLKPDFIDVRILKDISGRDRFVSFRNAE